MAGTAGPAAHGSEAHQQAYRELPSVASVIAEARRTEISTLSDEVLSRAIQEQLDDARRAIAGGASLKRAEIVARVLRALSDLERPRLAPTINATGILIHTNLGRAPVSQATAQAMHDAAASFVPLEIEAVSNERGGRMREISALLRLLTSADDCVVVNNNAAAVLLVLSSLAAGRSVIVSRGEAVEIGGGFRIPDVLRQSGARLVEVGTTNRTYARDYEQAIDDSTAAILKVHPSNFALSGFIRSASIAELAPIAKDRQIPIIEDLGSGALLDTARFGLSSEPTIAGSLAQGATLVTASGDKLLGGPQAGIIAGSRSHVDVVARHPLARAVRADKVCLAGVASTLRHYSRGDAVDQIPVWRMIAADVGSLRERAQKLVAYLTKQGLEASVVDDNAAVGGGSLPGQTLLSVAIALRDAAVDERARRLRLGSPPVFGRIEGGRVVLNLRSVLPEDDDALLGAIVASVATPGDPSSPANPDYPGSMGSAAG